MWICSFLKWMQCLLTTVQPWHVMSVTHGCFLSSLFLCSIFEVSSGTLQLLRWWQNLAWDLSSWGFPSEMALLSDPGVPGVRSMGQDSVTHWVSEWHCCNFTDVTKRWNRSDAGYLIRFRNYFQWPTWPTWPTWSPLKFFFAEVLHK